MEVIEIKSSHKLGTSSTGARPEGTYSYKLNCRQYVATYRDWQRGHQTEAEPLGVMTLGFEQIWITQAEGEQVAAAIKAANSPVILE